MFVSHNQSLRSWRLVVSSLIIKPFTWWQICHGNVASSRSHRSAIQRFYDSAIDVTVKDEIELLDNVFRKSSKLTLVANG